MGGAELDIVRNFPRLNRDEFEVVVVCFQTAGTLAPELERQGVRVIARGVPALDASVPRARRLFRRIGYALRVVPWIGRTLKAEEADIVHFFLPHSYGYGMLACMLTRVRAKRVMSRLSLNFYSRGHRVLSWLERNIFHRHLDIAIGNSKLILEELAEEGVDRSKLRLLYNGIDTTRFERHEGDRERARRAMGIEPQAFVMLSIGNLWGHKGHADLIEACAMGDDSLPTAWSLLIAGRDEENNAKAYTQLIEENALSGHVSLLGERQEVCELLMAADVFVQPSHHEGLPNALLEAMAASLPVVASAVGGIPEAVTAAPDREETGWLVRPHDTEALCAALLEAAADDQRRESMGSRAHARVVREFSLDASVAAYEAIYRELSA